MIPRYWALTVYLVKRLSRITMLLLIGIGLYIIWIASIHNTSEIGILFAIILFSLQGLVLDITYYIYVSIRHPFKIGDMIEIDGVTGIVDDMDIL